ncbi:MAG: DUF2244 domain-containing protein, partial [Candidatus Saccharibacteria bacterium]|nr:DUF2244 domain-containing protein [Pseudorhodobacter sp.]
VTRLRLWPHRSLSRRGFAMFIGITAAMLALPLATQIGTPGLWILLAFVAATLGGVWFALQHSYRTGSVTEDLVLTRDLISLHRTNPATPAQDWQANPHWVRTTLHPTGGPVLNYLTLSGNQRDVELGAFLQPDERQQIHDRLQYLLSTLHLPLDQPPPA